MVKRVFIGVDPGDVTGIAFLDLEGAHFVLEVPGAEAVSHIKTIADRAPLVRIGSEQFVDRGRMRKTHQPLAQQINGAIIALDHPTTLIAPATAKKMCNDHRLKNLGWYERTKDGHKNDASRILFATIALVSPRMVKDLLDLR